MRNIYIIALWEIKAKWECPVAKVGQWTSGQCRLL